MNDMNITEVQYVSDALSANTGIIKATIDGQELFVPLDLANRHYFEIMRQVEAGELIIAEAD